MNQWITPITEACEATVKEARRNVQLCFTTLLHNGLNSVYHTRSNLSCNKQVATFFSWVVKRVTSLFISFCSHVIKQVTGFFVTSFTLPWISRVLDNRTTLQMVLSDNSVRHVPALAIRPLDNVANLVEHFDHFNYTGQKKNQGPT